MNHVIITCDDCGLSEGINLAAARLHEQGIATAASIMTNLAATRHAFDLFAHYPALELGIHLNLTEGAPLSHLPRSSALLDSDGRFRPRTVLFTAALLPGTPYLRQVEAELTAQIEYFLETGQTPQHLTTHMHFHVLPTLREIVARLARRYHIPWIRSFHAQASILPYTAPIQRALPVPVNGCGVSTPDYLAGVYFWVGRPPGTLCQRLGTLPGTSEIVVHPGQISDPTFPESVAYQPHQRAAESRYMETLHALCNREFSPTSIEKSGILRV
ncbi:MAG: ChbG/HpnK family deacetylase [Anaerolineae bacterium]|nr:ChbG/HpnK family deacetylase [Anaerolineae bacterium]